jgi:hypothetical protein
MLILLIESKVQLEEKWDKKGFHQVPERPSESWRDIMYSNSKTKFKIRPEPECFTLCALFPTSESEL